MLKRCIAMLLAIAMVIGFSPLSVLALDGEMENADTSESGVIEIVPDEEANEPEQPEITEEQETTEEEPIEDTADEENELAAEESVADDPAVEIPDTIIEETERRF